MSDPKSRHTDAPYGPEEADRIRAMLRQPGVTLVCPRCGGPLVAGPPVAAGGSIVGIYIVRCPECRRALMASDIRPA